MGTALAALLALSGCDLPDRADRETAADPTSAASQPPPTSGEPEPDEPADDRLRSTTVTLDGVVLRVAARAAPAVAADESAPDAQRVTLSLSPGGSARLALLSDGALDVDSDGSILVLDGGGTPVAAIGPPEPPSHAEDVPRIEVTETDATHARVELDDRTRPAQGTGSGSPGSVGGPARTEPLPFTFAVGTRAIESATWGENEGGRSLAVDPTDWARHAGEAGVDLIRTQLVAAEPGADSATMGDQLVCHAMGAPDKSTWNLEPWRPDVGLILTATAQCNPV